MARASMQNYTVGTDQFGKYQSRRSDIYLPCVGKAVKKRFRTVKGFSQLVPVETKTRFGFGIISFVD
jgi:hypothetical protein